MTGTKIKNFSHSAAKTAAAAEHLSALEPACKDHIIGLRNIEKLAVHLFCGDIYAAVNTLSNRVIGSSAPQLFAVVISPFKGHAGAEQSLHRLAEMGGVQTYTAFRILYKDGTYRTVDLVKGYASGFYLNAAQTAVNFVNVTGGSMSLDLATGEISQGFK